MSDYKIVGLVEHNIAIEFDGEVINFPLPIVDGYYPENEELSNLLQHYVDNARAARLIALKQRVVANNELAIRSLISESDMVKASTAKKVIRKRNQLLSRTDYTQMSDSSVSSDDKVLWAIYRNALRDITNQQDFPSVVWASAPYPVFDLFGNKITDDDGAPLSVSD